jgi:hypothetical protein
MTTSTTTGARPATARPRRRGRRIKYSAVPIIVLLARAAFDLSAPRRTTMRDFDADEVARLETAMRRSSYSRQRVKLFRVPAGRLAEHARLRAEAMEIRDTKADRGGVTEEDRRRIDGLLRGSWRSLHAAVNPGKH